MKRSFAVLVATGFGLGYSPVASGTVGTLLAVPLVWGSAQLLSLPAGVVWQVVLATVLALLAIPVCGVAESRFGTKDDGRIVADEYLTFPICMIGLPWTWQVLLLSFLTCRFFDIVKPPPARRLQELHGGFGIVIDDVFASVYSLLVNHLTLRFCGGWFGLDM